MKLIETGKANDLGDTERQFWTSALSDRSLFVKKFQILSKNRISKGILTRLKTTLISEVFLQYRRVHNTWLADSFQ